MEAKGTEKYFRSRENSDLDKLYTMSINIKGLENPSYRFLSFPAFYLSGRYNLTFVIECDPYTHRHKCYFSLENYVYSYAELNYFESSDLAYIICYKKINGKIKLLSA